MGVKGVYLSIVGYTGPEKVQIVGEDGSDDQSTLGSAGDKGNLFNTLTQRFLGYKNVNNSVICYRTKLNHY